MKRITRATRMLVATGLVASGLLAACGDDRSGEATTQTKGQAGTSSAAVERQVEARKLAVAERLERIAKLDGLAKTHSTKAGRTDDQTSELVPGSRHMPMR
jgi:hypothetical protein